MFSLIRLKESKYLCPKQKLPLVHQIAENKGRQEINLIEAPDTITQLINLAMIESVKSSTAIEGVKVPEYERLSQLVNAKSWKPKNRDEADVLAYKETLSYVYQKSKKIKLNLETIENLTKMLWSHEPSKAGLKKADNKIVLRFPDGSEVIRFTPPSAKETPKLLSKSCELYHQLLSGSDYIDHQIISAFILDFLCIHPLSDGNGRIARILHNLLLLQNGYEVVRIISQEALVEKDKKSYYDALYRSSKNWASGTHNINPWMNFSLGKLNIAYQQLENILKQGQVGGVNKVITPTRASIERILESVRAGQRITRKSLEEKSQLSGRTIRRVLNDWVKEGRLVIESRGPGTTYYKIR